jgi:hypothetical protein
VRVFSHKMFSGPLLSNTGYNIIRSSFTDIDNMSVSLTLIHFKARFHKCHIEEYSPKRERMFRNVY